MSRLVANSLMLLFVFPWGLVHADVDLRIEGPTIPVAVGEIIEVRLIATATPSPEAFTVIDAVLSWDSDRLLFLDVDDTADCCEWFLSGFFPDTDGVNSDLADGDFIYSALAAVGTPFVCPTDPGFLITTFRFMTLAPSTGTSVGLLPTLGGFAETRVLGAMPGVSITGDISGAASVVIEGPPEFLRGDSNGDGELDISDAVHALQFLFVALAPIPGCLDSTDVNDNGVLEVSDPILLLSYLFQSGAQLPAPTLVCGIDPTNDLLSCDAYFCP